MIRLKGVNTQLEVVLGESVGSELDVVCSYGNIKFTSAELTDLDSRALKTTNTTPIIIAGPSASETDTVGVEQISIYNDNGRAHTVKVQINDGIDTFVIKGATLQPGDSLLYDNGWAVEKKNNIGSSSNTTTTPLSPSQEFIGPWENVDERDIIASIECDTNATSYFEFSDDQINFVSVPPEGHPLFPGNHEFHVKEKAGRFFRLRIHNGLTAMTYLRAYTYYGEYRTPTASLNQSLSGDADATTTRPSDFFDEVAIGRREETHSHVMFGNRSVLNIADGSALICPDNTTNTPTIITAPDTYTITYTPASDGLGTNGALSLLIEHIDQNGEEQYDVHTLSNTGSDVTSFSGYGVNGMTVLSSGAASPAVNDNNVAAISIEDTTGGNVFTYMPAATGISKTLVFYCPFNATAVLKKTRLSATKITGATPVISWRGKVWVRNTGITIDAYEEDMDTALDNRLEEDPGYAIDSGNVVWVEAETDKNASVVSGRFVIVTYNNGILAAAGTGLYAGATIAEHAIGEIGIGGNS